MSVIVKKPIQFGSDIFKQTPQLQKGTPEEVFSFCNYEPRDSNRFAPCRKILKTVGFKSQGVGAKHVFV